MFFVVALVLGCGILVPVALYYFTLAVVRRQNARPLGRCPLCNTTPAELDVTNVCRGCGCEYDKWGNLVSGPSVPPRPDLDLSRFESRHSTSGPGAGSAEFKKDDGLHPSE